jgi:hypothetical protein
MTTTTKTEQEFHAITKSITITGTIMQKPSGMEPTLHIKTLTTTLITERSGVTARYVL